MTGTATAPTRVVLADDPELIRAGLWLVIDRAPGLAVVGEAATGHDAIRVVREARADVVLMDIRMPGLDGRPLPGGSSLTTVSPGVRVLIRAVHRRRPRPVAIEYTRRPQWTAAQRNHGQIAGLSRALTEGLRHQQTDEESDRVLTTSVAAIYASSTTQWGASTRNGWRIGVRGPAYAFCRGGSSGVHHDW